MHNGMKWDGQPSDPDRSGWHWVEDADGLRPLLWRGEDWPEQVDRGEWQDGYAILSPRDLRRGKYHGPVAMPLHLSAAFRLRLLRGAT